MKPRNSSNGHFSKSSYHQQQNHYAQQPQYQQQHNTTGHFPSNHKSTATAAASVSTTPASTLKSIDPSLKEKFNFDYLRRKDPKVVKILHTFDHIVLYKVNEAGEWSKESVEGSMFVVERENNELPLMQSYRFVVMNRRSTENYFQEITPALELQLNSPFVLYRDGTTDDIRGLWFYNTLQSLYFVDAVNNIIEKLRTSATEHNYQHEGEMHQHPEQLHYHQHVDMSHQSYAPTLSTENVNEAATNLLKSTLGLSFGNESSSAVESTDLGVPSENQSLDELEQQLLAQLNTTEPQLGVPEIPYPQQEVQNEEVKQEEQNDVMSFFKQHNINLHVMPSPQGPPSAQHEQVQAAPPPLDILKPQNLLKSLLGNTVCSDEEENEEEEHEGGESENQVAPAQLPGEVNIQEQLLQVLPAQAVASAVDKNAAFDGIHTKGDFKTMLVSMLEDSENTVLLDSLFEQFQKLRSEQGHQFIETE